MERIPGPAIWVEGLFKGFGGQPVLRDLSLTVPWGEFLVIFGSNGAGKTTLLRILSTQSKPDRGLVRVGGLDRRRDAPRIRRLVGVVAHQDLLYVDLTVAENLRFYGRMYGIQELPSRITRVLHEVGLAEHRDQRVGTLSHGMQKRLALARAILHAPPILLLDEPEAGLDPEALEGLGVLLRSWRGGDRTVVMTTHDLEQGLALGDRIAILVGGGIAFDEAREGLDVAGFKDTLLRYTGVAW
ncbi:MAG: heme ABC exporter ATP-binding protein CcmA [Dehalococcoidia bacterium]